MVTGKKSPVADGLVEKIVEKVMQELAASEKKAAVSEPSAVADGVFREMEDAIQAAVGAHRKMVQLPLDVREKIIRAIRDTGWKNREEYGRMDLPPAR